MFYIKTSARHEIIRISSVIIYCVVLILLFCDWSLKITIMNAGRKYLHLESLKGKVLLTSGLGGMSGAQAKAAVIAGAVGVIVEVNKDALLKR